MYHIYTLEAEEKEEEPYEAVAIAVKAKTVEDVKLGQLDKLHKQISRVEAIFDFFIAEEAMPE